MRSLEFSDQMELLMGRGDKREGQHSAARREGSSPNLQPKERTRLSHVWQLASVQSHLPLKAVLSDWWRANERCPRTKGKVKSYLT